MIIPQHINPGDKIRIISPAGKLKEERVMPAVSWLREKGYEVELGKHVFSQHFQYAGKDAERQSDLQEALNDAECKAIICARGGYGTVRIIDQVDFAEFRKYPKWLAGYSDVTVLHRAINNLGYATIHGSMPPFFFDKEGNETENVTSLMDLLQGRKTEYVLGSCEGKATASAEGSLIGGNLSILTSLIGTKYDFESKGKILFIEDIDEYRYHIDRMMIQLKLAGKLAGLAGLVVGDFTDIKDNDAPFGQSVREIILDAVREYDYPLCFGLKAGHGDLNLALSFGQQYVLDVLGNENKLKLVI